jgi:hypothetical protein
MACGDKSDTKQPESMTTMIKVGDTVAATFPNKGCGVFEIGQVTSIEGTRVTIKTQPSAFNNVREETKLTDIEYILPENTPLVDSSSLKVGDAVVFTNANYEQLGVAVAGTVSSTEDGKVDIVHKSPTDCFRVIKQERLKLPPPTRIFSPNESLANRIKNGL